jgi:hypothetical protein
MFRSLATRSGVRGEARRRLGPTGGSLHFNQKMGFDKKKRGKTA